MRVHAVDEYYRAAAIDYPQALKRRGFGDDEIGTHAGLADTSLALAVDPGLVRMERAALGRRERERRRRARGSAAGDRGTGAVGRRRDRGAERGRDPEGGRAQALNAGMERRQRGIIVERKSLRRGIAAVFCAAAGLSFPGPASVASGPPGAAAPAVAGASRPCPACRRWSIRANLYSETTAGKLSPAVAGDLPRVYVPHVKSNDVYVIDPATLKVVDKFKVGMNPQHVVPSWDLRTLWVANNAEGRQATAA